MLAAAGLLAAVNSHAGLQIPYVPNANTLHLWHLDDPAGQLYATDAVTTASITLTNLGWPSPGTGPYTNTAFGNPSYPGLGTSVGGPGSATPAKAHLLYGGAFSNVSQFRNPVTGAFTFEALIYCTVNPLGTIDAEIVAGDNGGAITARGWQWRLSNGVMEWDLLAGGTDNDYKMALPASGPDAALVNTWYHAAVTFTGYSPTNGDTPNILSMYWTLLDANRVNADVLTNVSFSGMRELDGATDTGGVLGTGTATPSLGVGGSARNITSNPANNEGVPGYIDEVRISQTCLRSNQMAFVTGGALNPPSLTVQPPATTLVGYGHPLTVAAIATGTLPLAYQWQQSGTNVPGQTNLTLSIASPTFAAAGPYQLIVTNPYGHVTSSICTVTVGASPAELFSTGLDTNGVLSAGDIVDSHWFLNISSDASFTGPALEIFENSCPIEFACASGSFSPVDGKSMWVGPGGNQGGATLSSPAGSYTYRTEFLLDSAVPSTIALNGVAWLSGSVTNVLLNGHPTGINFAPGGTLYTANFVVTNQYFVPGLNTLDFQVSMGSGVAAFRAELSGVGQALPGGLPVITTEPVGATVRDSSVQAGSSASFSVVALGSPPLSYQWWADGSPVSGATARTLQFPNPTAGGQGTNFTVVVVNPYGAVTSQVATLMIVATNQPPVAATLNYVGFFSQNLSVPLSTLVQASTDPDGDAVSYLGSDVISTNAVQYGSNNVLQVGAALVYMPVVGYVGDDQFSYTIGDPLGATAVGYVNILELPSPAPAAQTVPPGATATLAIGLSAPPAGYTFQWQFNGGNLPGATGGSLTITNATPANSGSYGLVVTDPHGVGWPSPTATLTVEAYAPQTVVVSGITDSSEQPGYGATNAVDGNFSTFWVSGAANPSPGDGPTPAHPEWLMVTFPQTVAIAEFLVYPRSGYGPGNVQMLFNGTVAYTGTMANSAAPLDVVLSPPVYATNAQLLITSSYDPSYPTTPRDTQVEELIFLQRAAPGTFGDWELSYFTNSAQINNPAISGITADPDGDGVPNLLEFAVGGNPLVPDATNATVRASSLPAGQVAVQFQERNQLGDVTRSFQSSTDLVHWTSATPVSVTPVQNLGLVSINQAVFPVQTINTYFRLVYTATDPTRQ